MIAAIIPAAGSGERFKAASSGIAKQFAVLADKPIYDWSLRQFMTCAAIDQVVLVVPSDAIESVSSQTEAYAQSGKKLSVIAGGATRQMSVMKGLEFLASCDPVPEFVLIHDAARPLVTSQLIEASIRAVTEFGACTLAIPVSDTIKRCDATTVAETVDRDQLVQIQTPQSARFIWMLEAHKKAVADNLSTTDDSTILQHNGHKVYIVPGSPYNLKITNPEDLSICHSLLKAIGWNGLQAAI